MPRMTTSTALRDRAQVLTDRAGALIVSARHDAERICSEKCSVREAAHCASTMRADIAYALVHVLAWVKEG